jgi:hypothetical protein
MTMTAIRTTSVEREHPAVRWTIAFAPGYGRSLRQTVAAEG